MTELRIAMWSGPRSISTALMRSFGARRDTVVVDEPFYAAYLAQTGLDHPLREEVLASQPHDWQKVVAQLFAPLSAGHTVQFQKHMTHHMLPSIGRAWLQDCRNAFLIRQPAAVLASYVQKRADVTLQDIGLPQQLEIHEQVSAGLGRPAPVIDSEDLLTNPQSVLSQLCEALDLQFDPCMLRWPEGRRASDGIWASAWYDAVERSTGFSSPRETEARTPQLTPALQSLAAQAQPYYNALAAHRIKPQPRRPA